MYVLVRAVVTGCGNSAAPIVGLRAMGHGVTPYWGSPAATEAAGTGEQVQSLGTSWEDVVHPGGVTACVPSYFTTQLKSVLY